MSTSIELADDEALVLFELVSSGKLLDHVDSSERAALWALEGILQKQLVAPFAADYSDQLQLAKASLAARLGE